jgi:ribosomal subunit interface protein
MKINLQTKNIDLTEALNDYVIKKVSNLGRLLEQIEKESGEVFVRFNVGRNTMHHKGGDVFEADCSITIKGKDYYSKESMEDLYQAIDKVKDNLFYEIGKSKDRKHTLFKRGGMLAKKMLKGISRRNPFSPKE